MRSLDPELCPKCFIRGRVYRSRPGKVRRRRRICPLCGHRWTTYESLVNPRRVIRKLAQKASR